MNLGIAGMGMTGGFGEGISDLKNALKNKKNPAGIAPVNCIDHSLHMSVFKATTEKLTNFFPARKLRRMDHFSRMALYSCILALKDADCDISALDSKRTGIILSTGFGSQDSTYKFKDSIFRSGDPGASPTLFSKSVHNAALANISMLLDIKGPGLTISQHGLSFQSALITAWTWLLNGEVDTVITGCVDEFCEPQGYSKYRWNESSGQNLPLSEYYLSDHNQGEGSFCMVLNRNKAGRYGSLINVRTGNLNFENPLADIKTPVIISGNPERLDLWLKKNQLSDHALVFKDIYGTSPVTSAFDLAVSALTLKSFPQITAFHVDSDNHYGLSVLSR